MMQCSKHVKGGAQVHVCVAVPPSGRSVSLLRVLKLDERDHLQKWSIFDGTTRQKWPEWGFTRYFFYKPYAINLLDCYLIGFEG